MADAVDLCLFPTVANRVAILYPLEYGAAVTDSYCLLSLVEARSAYTPDVYSPFSLLIDCAEEFINIYHFKCEVLLFAFCMCVCYYLLYRS